MKQSKKDVGRFLRMVIMADLHNRMQMIKIKNSFEDTKIENQKMKLTNFSQTEDQKGLFLKMMNRLIDYYSRMRKIFIIQFTLIFFIGLYE